MPFLTISSAYTLSSGNSLTACFGDATAAPERIALPQVTASGNASAQFVVAYAGAHNNSTSTFNAWPITTHITPAGTNTTVFSTPSATSSEWTGLVYLGYQAFDTVAAGYCMGVAATDPESLLANTFSSPVRCTSDTTGAADGTMIRYDRGGTDLWSIEKESSSQHRLQVFENCHKGPPGCCVTSPCTPTCTATVAEPCPVTTTVLINVGPVHDDASIAVNPCTHNLLTIYKETSTNDIRLQARTPTGGLLYDVVAQTNQPHQDNTSCSGGQVRTCPVGTGFCSNFVPAPGTIPCMTLRSHPQITTTSYDGACFAVLAWEYSYTSSGDSKRYFAGRWETWDITSDAALPLELKAWISHATSGNFNEFGIQVAANGPNGMVGYYHDSSSVGGCDDGFRVTTDNNLFRVTATTQPDVSGHFPSIRFGTNNGFSWTQTFPNGLDQEALQATWTEPVCMTSGTCATCAILSCASNQWSFRVRGATISGLYP